MKLNKEKIRNEKFESVINGYSPTKVDLFLEDVIDDYQEMEDKISELIIKNKELELQLEQAKTKIDKLENKDVD